MHPSAGIITLALLLVPPALYFWTQLVLVIRVVRAVPRLADLPPPSTRRLSPRVSAILTARNEEDALEAAVAARLGDSYPDLELILVDDRSTDRTPEIADRLAARDPRLRVVHLRALPDGWLGKLHALHEGARLATGDWLLFSDADVSVRDGALARAVDYCERRGLDHLAVFPGLRPAGALVDCLVSVFLRLVVLNLRIWAIEDPASRAAMGVGAFNLVRRAAFARTPGFEHLRMEVADDLALGQMLKRHGARQSVVSGVGLVDLVFHRSVGDALRSAERATWTALARFSLLRITAISLVLAWLELLPYAALAFIHAPLIVLLGLGALVPLVATSLVVDRWFRRSSAPLVLLPVAQLITIGSNIRAGVLGRLRGGIRWRGTFYPESVLRAGRRVEL